ncbi:MAG: hypothetical protein ACYCQI_10420 [Gammaproteobacteria bacterium]
MCKQLLGLLFIICLALSTLTFAAHGFGNGNGMGFGHHGGAFTTGRTPPGLHGHLPYGLSKQNKIPAGWSHGNKEGWDRSVPAHTVPVTPGPAVIYH